MHFKTIINRIKNNQLINDSIWSLFGNVIGKGLALFAGIFIARFLGKDIFGEYGIIRNTILTIGVFSTFGLGYTATKYIADLKKSFPEKIKVFIKYSVNITLLFSGTMAVLLFIFADFISIKFLDSQDLSSPLRILSVLIIFNAISTTQTGILAGFGQFKKLARINSIVGVFTFIVSVILTYFYGLNGALLALLFVQILNCALNFFAIKTEMISYQKGITSDKFLRKDIIVFSTPIALQEFIFSFTGWVGTVLLVKYASYGELGMYTAAMQWNSIILFIPGILRNVVLSHLSSNVADKGAHHFILKRTIQINFIATLIPCILVAIFSSIIAKTYGNTYTGLAPLIFVAVFSTVFTSISNVYSQAYTSLGKNWVMLYLRTARDVFTLLGFILLVQYSYFGGALSMVISTTSIGFIFLLIITIYYKRKL